MARVVDDATVREMLIKRGVINLREFGYPQCNAKNILTDMLYKKFFESMLNENLGQGYDKQIQSLLDELAKA